MKKILIAVHFLLLLCNGSFSQTWETDSAAVQAILDSNNVTSTTVNFITTVEDGRIVKVELSHLGLRVLPAQIGMLDSLDTLDLRDNQLGSLPSEMFNLTNLERLIICDNNLTELTAETGNLSNLEFLDVRRNDLQSIAPEIGNLTKLKRLYLSQNKLISLPAEIGNLPALEFLSLSWNELTSIPPEIGDLSNLKWLFIHTNKLIAIASTIGNLSKIESLNLSNNQLGNLPDSIVLLSPTFLNIESNKLCYGAVTPQLRAWLDSHCNGWQYSQECKIPQIVNPRKDVYVCVGDTLKYRIEYSVPNPWQQDVWVVPTSLPVWVNYSDSRLIGVSLGAPRIDTCKILLAESRILPYDIVYDSLILSIHIAKSANEPHFTSAFVDTAIVAEPFGYKIKYENPFGGNVTLTFSPNNPSWLYNTPDSIFGTPQNPSRVDTFTVILSVQDVEYDTLSLRIFIIEKSIVLPWHINESTPSPILFMTTTGNGISCVVNVCEEKELNLSIYDIMGKELWKYEIVIAGQSYHKIKIDALQGKRIKNGMYIAIVKQMGIQGRRKFILIKIGQATRRIYISILPR